MTSLLPRFSSLLFPLLVLLPTARGQETNLVAGLPYTVNLEPNYRSTEGPNDPGKDPKRSQLTDGIFSVTAGRRTPRGHFWNTPTSVAWKTFRRNPEGAVEITFDLGSRKAIQRISFQTAGGAIGWERFEWPLAALLFVSDDGVQYRFVEDLLFASSWEKPPPSGAYDVHRFDASNLDTAGRHVRIIFVPTPSTTNAVPLVLDEIEIFGKSTADSAANPEAPLLFEGEQWATPPVMTWLGLRKRLQRDWVRLRELGAPQKALAPLKHEINALLPGDPLPEEPGMVASTPIGEALLRLRGGLLAPQGEAALRVSEVDRWSPLDPLAAPPDSPAGPVSLAGIVGEKRSRALLLTNPGVEPRTVVFTLPAPEGIRVGFRQADFLDTPFFEQLPSRLRPLAKAEGGFQLDLKAGESKIVWLDADFLSSPPASAGATASTTLTITDGNGPQQSIPIHFRRFGWKPVSPPIYASGFDYADQEPNFYSLTPKNRTSFVQCVEEGGIDTLFATRLTLPSGQYNAEGQMTAPPDTTRLHRWLARWTPGKRLIFYMRAYQHFPNIPSEQLPIVIKQWCAFWEQEFRKMGIDPSTVVLHLVDEPKTEAKLEQMLQFTRILKESGSNFKTWSNPNSRFLRPGYERFYDHVDIVTAHRPQLTKQHDECRKFLAALRAKGKQIELYSCMGPMQRLSPLHYVRLQAWDVFSLDGIGHCIWSLSDGSPGGAVNAYLHSRAVSNTPLAFSGDRVDSTPHFEAMREGTWDVHYLQAFSKLRGKFPEDPEGQALEKRLRTWMDREVFFDRAYELMAWTPREAASKQADELLLALGEWIEKNTPPSTPDQ